MHIRRFTKGRLAPVLVAGAALLALGLAACGGDDDASPTAVATTAAAQPSGAAGSATESTQATLASDIGKNDSAHLTGAGSTFAAPLYQAWADDYGRSVAKNVEVNYQSVGSGAGITAFTNKTVDFGASDVALSDTQLQAAPDVQIVPVAMGAVTLTYNLSGISSLKLDGPTIANIYLGNIKKWNDPAIAGLNPGVNLPNADIQVAYRSDSSGTSGVFTDYLSKVSDEWKSKVGAANAPNWPTGQGGQGNAGVANVVKQTPNSIGYVELTYALQNKLSFADVRNKAGKFVTPSPAAASAAADAVTIPSPQYAISVTNADGDSTYPISSFTYALLYKTTGACSQQTPLVDFLWWAFHAPTAAQTLKDQSYAPLPANLLPRIEDTLKSLKCDGGKQSSLKGS